MRVTLEQGSEWRDWLLTTSIPLVHLGNTDQVLGVGSGTMIDHEGRRFLVTAEHVARLDSKGWAIVVQQHPDGRLEYYKPHAFVHVGEFSRADASLRTLDLCAAQVAPDLKTWYEYRSPRGLFDKKPHHVFEAGALALPEHDQLFGFSGRVRTEMHGPQTFASEMTVFPGLTYARNEGEEHHFALPVPHPGHDTIRGTSGSPMCDFSRRLVGIVVGGSTDTNTVRCVAIQRVFPALHFLGAHIPVQRASGKA
jgi:hypothetical protein